MCNVQRVMDCFFTWRATIATICNDERLEQTGTDSGALSGRLSDLIPGLKPWAISVGPFHGQRPWVWSPTYSVRTISWPRTTYRFRSASDQLKTYNVKPITYNFIAVPAIPKPSLPSASTSRFRPKSHSNQH